jgi:hypothetical protein
MQLESCWRWQLLQREIRLEALAGDVMAGERGWYPDVRHQPPGDLKRKKIHTYHPQTGSNTYGITMVAQL